MKNKLNSIFGPSILLAAVLGCSFYDPFAGNTNRGGSNNNQSLTNQAVESTVGGTTTGVKECDELLVAIAEQSKNSDEDFITRGTREFFLNRLRDGVRKTIEENKTDQAKMAKNCADYKIQLDKFKTEETNKQSK